MRANSLLLLILIALAPWVGADAEPALVTVPKEAREDLSITIYQGGYAQVRDRRRLEIPGGRTDVRFADVAALIQPETAIVRGLGGGVRLLEANFDYDLLTPHSLLQNSVGGEVWFLRALPKDSRDVREAARLLSAAGGAVLRVGNRLEVLSGGEPERRIAYRGLPEQLRPSPTLSLALESEDAAEGEVLLSYITEGISWSGTHRIYLTRDGRTAGIAVYMTLWNESGIAYENAELHGLAGRLNRVRDPVPLAAPEASADKETIIVTGSRIIEVSDYQIYTIPRRVSIANSQEKQLELLSAEEVAVETFYAIDLEPGDELEEFVAARSLLRIENSKENGLGVPLPSGGATIYQRDAAGRAVFINEDHLPNLPVKESARLELGVSSLITGSLEKGEKSDFSCRALGAVFERCESEEFYVFRVGNPGGRPQRLELTHRGFQNARIIESNLDAQTDGKVIRWAPVTIAPGQSIEFDYAITQEYTRRIRGR